MKKHILVKEVIAEPMTRAAYNAFRCFALSADEDGTDEGFLVEDVGGGPCNVKGRAGYVSWSPIDVFNRHFRSTEGMTFGFAIEAAKAGKKIARAGWNGKNMFVYYVPENSYHAKTAIAKESFGNGNVPYRAYLALKTAQGDIATWSPSTSDALAEDWTTVE